MCGITAISANKEALPFLLQGLEKLEYRGYDSAGIAQRVLQQLKETIYLQKKLKAVFKI